MSYQDEFSPAEIELYRLQNKIDIVKQLMSHELDLKAYVNVKAKFEPNLYAIDEEYLKSVNENARIRYNQLADELKILELKLKTVREKIPCENSEFPW